jgi:hypothetical protein
LAAAAVALSGVKGAQELIRCHFSTSRFLFSRTFYCDIFLEKRIKPLSLVDDVGKETRLGYHRSVCRSRRV